MSFRTLLFSCAALAAMVASASAADLPNTKEEPAYVPPPPPPSWTGFYIGGDLGARFTNTDGAVTSGYIGDPAVSILSGAPGGSSLDSAGFRGGVFLGYNWELAQQWVVGIEGDAGWSNSGRTSVGSPYPSNLSLGIPAFPGPYPLGGTTGDSFSERTPWDGSLRLRAGWLVTPAALLYVTGGASWLSLDTTSTCSTISYPGADCANGNYFNGTLGPPTVTHSQTRLGWTVGAGVETKLGNNWLLRAEYRYADYGTANFNDVRTCPGCEFEGESSPLSISYQERVVTHTVLVGAAYLFDFGSPR